MLGRIDLQKIKQLLAKASVFAVTLSAVIWVMYALPSTAAFWNILNIRFSQDEKYQVQTLFLPDQQRDYSVLIIGDSLFQQSIPERIVNQTNAERIVLNSYDADDLRAVARSLQPALRHTTSTVCTLLVQVSPIFSLRSTALGGELDATLIDDALNRSNPGDHVKAFFEIVQKWAQADPSLPDLNSDPTRPPRMIGQAKFADPNKENWERAFSRFSGYDGQIIGVLDTRETDWGADGNLIGATVDNLNLLADEDPRFSWTTLNSLPKLPTPGCTSK